MRISVDFWLIGISMDVGDSSNVSANSVSKRPLFVRFIFIDISIINAAFLRFAEDGHSRWSAQRR